MLVQTSSLASPDQAGDQFARAASAFSSPYHLGTNLQSIFVQPINPGSFSKGKRDDRQLLLNQRDSTTSTEAVTLHVYYKHFDFVRCPRAMLVSTNTRNEYGGLSPMAYLSVYGPEACTPENLMLRLLQAAWHAEHEPDNEAER